LMAGLILLLMYWADDPTPAGVGLAATWIGLSLGHHLATALLAAGAFFFVAAHLRRKMFRPTYLLAAAARLLAGLSIYLYLTYLYFGAPAFNYAGRYDAALQFHPVDLASP